MARAATSAARASGTGHGAARTADSAPARRARRLRQGGAEPRFGVDERPGLRRARLVRPALGQRAQVLQVVLAEHAAGRGHHVG